MVQSREMRGCDQVWRRDIIMIASLTFWLALIVAHGSCTPGDYRLPKAIAPLHYNLRVITNIDEAPFHFEGNVAIQIRVLEGTDKIILHARDLRIAMRQVVLTDIYYYHLPIYEKYLAPQFDFLVLRTDFLNADEEYILYIPFTGYLNDRLAGYYFSQYFSLEKKRRATKWCAVTQFEPTDARRAFPCFDEPAFKATFTISLAHHKKYKALSNMPVIGTSVMPDKPSFIWEYYNDTLPMSSYLVAFFLSEFSQVNLTKGDSTELNIWCRPDALYETQFAQQVSAKIMQYFEDYFEISYLLPKLDMVAIPDFYAGAMENWGLITFRESMLLYTPKSSSLIEKVGVASVIAHEMAHQWFGDMVTMSWWVDIWLNEGFATYMSMLAVDQIHPEWDSFDLEVVESFLDVYYLDALQSSHPISVKIQDPSEIQEIFDVITYRKGALMLRMLNMILGEEVFRKGISWYLQNHALSNTQQDHLWATLSEEAYRERSLSPEMSTKIIMDSWTLQSGYPLITVDRNYEIGTAVVTQTRYFSSDRLAETANTQCWSVPLSFTTASTMYFYDEMPKAWTSCKQPQVIINLPSANKDWVIFNIRISALYKVQYDLKNWDLLLKALKCGNHTNIDPLNRFALVNDALDLASIGKLSYDVALQFLQYLPNDQSYLPWTAAFFKMDFLYQALLNTTTEPLFRNFAERIITPLCNNRMNLKSFRHIRDEESVQVVKFRILIIRWSFRLKICNSLRVANETLAKWMKEKKPDIKNPIPAELCFDSFCAAVRYGEQKKWDFLYERYLKSNVANEKNMLLNVLGCSNDRQLLERYLEWSMDANSSGIRSQDTDLVFRSVALNGPVGFITSKRFLMNNIDRIYYFYGGKASAKISLYLRTLATMIFSEDEAQDINNFVAENQKYLTKLNIGLKQVRETIQANMLWRERNFEKITATLKRITSGTDKGC